VRVLRSVKVTVKFELLQPVRTFRREFSTYLGNDSPSGSQETDWLVTVVQPQGLLCLPLRRGAPIRTIPAPEGA
jgi:hypothetical protein